jgi:CheY-like chemotaxis protein
MSKKRILIVDDNETNLKLFSQLLLFPNYELQTVTTAALARVAVASFKPDLILLDVQLPDMDGLTLARLLKADETTRSIPIVAVTAYAMKGDEERARASGVDGYLTKPVERHEFRRIVAEYLSKGGSNAPDAD